MRRTLVLAVIAVAVAAPAIAQTTRVQTTRAQPTRNFEDLAATTAAKEKDPGYRSFERQLSADLERRKSELAQTGVLADVSAVEPLPPPAHWTGTMDAWRTHMTRCQTRYRSYDAETDMYHATATDRRRCTL